MRNPGRDLDKMTDSEKVNHTYWELSLALGWIAPGETQIEANLNEVLEEAVLYIRTARFSI